MLMEEEETQEAAMIEEQAPAEGIMSKEQM